MTGMKGSYEIHIVMHLPEPPAGGGNRKDGSLPPPGSPPPVDFVGDAFRRTVEQLGLKLEARKAPIEMITVDHVERDRQLRAPAVAPAPHSQVRAWTPPAEINLKLL
jgi:uncharacterized protein (TIGR03435 family)